MNLTKLREKAWMKSCPRCHAQPGKPCTVKDNPDIPLNVMHCARYSAADPDYDPDSLRYNPL